MKIPKINTHQNLCYANQRLLKFLNQIFKFIILVTLKFLNKIIIEYLLLKIQVSEISFIEFEFYK